jgi:hypothetical protein
LARRVYSVQWGTRAAAKPHSRVILLAKTDHIWREGVVTIEDGP